MSKRKLNNKFLSNQAGQSNPNGKRPQFNRAYPNELAFSNKFMKNFKRNNDLLHFALGSKGYCVHTRTINQFQEETRTPTAGVTYKFPVVTKNTVVVSDDGKPVVLFFVKNGLQLPFNYTAANKAYNPQLKDVDIHHLGLDAIFKLTKAYPPPKLKAKDKRHTGSKHLAEDDVGFYHLTFWQEDGHRAEEETKLDLKGGAFINTESYPSKGKADGQVRNLGAVFQHHSDMTPVFQAMSALFELVNYKNYEQYRVSHHELARATDLRLCNNTSRNCFLGSALLISLKCNPHKDMNDVMDGWVMDAAFGDFDGGNLQCHQLGLKFDLGPRDVVMMCSRLLTHGIAPVTKGKRYSTVLFSHDSMIKTHSEMMDEMENEGRETETF